MHNAPPLLTLPVQEQILLTAIHLTALHHSAPSKCGRHISIPLNALPRSICPNLTKAALSEMMWIDMDLASKLGDVHLLDFMLAWSSSRGMSGSYRRPVQYTEDVDDGALCLAAQRGHLHVIQWWFQHCDSGELPLDMSSIRYLEAASHAGHFHILDWFESCWSTRTLNQGNSRKRQHQRECCGNCVPESTDPSLRLQALVWWHRNFAASHHVMLHVYAASNAGHLDVLRWWYSVSSSASILDCLDVRAAVNSALAHGHLHVLNWLVDEHNVDLAVLAVSPASGPRRFNSSINLVGLVDMITKQQHSSMDWWSGKQLPVGPTIVEMLCAACGSGDMRTLDWLTCNYEKECREISEATVQLAFAKEACGKGHLEIVKLLAKGQVFGPKLTPSTLTADVPQGNDEQVSQISFLRTMDPFFTATNGGHLHVMEWLRSTGGFKPFVGLADVCRLYLECAGWNPRQVELLNWWKAQIPGTIRSQIGRFEPQRSLLHASAFGDVDQLNWWASESYLPLALELGGDHKSAQLKSLVKYVRAASKNGHVQVLQWWADRFRHQMRRISLSCWVDDAIAAGQVDVLRWWLDKFDGLHRIWEVSVLDIATKHGQIAVLEWCRDELVHRLDPDMMSFLCVSQDAFNWTSAAGKLEVLDWWLNKSPWPFRYSGKALEPVCKDGFVSFGWWLRQGFTFDKHKVSYFAGRNALALDLLLRLQANVHVSVESGISFQDPKLDLVAEGARFGCFPELLYLRDKPGYWPSEPEQRKVLVKSVRDRGHDHVALWLEKQFGFP